MAPAAGVEKVHDMGDVGRLPYLLLGLVEKMTGFPNRYALLQLRLLDDLDLDSIKSAGLLAEAAMQLGVARGSRYLPIRQCAAGGGD